MPKYLAYGSYTEAGVKGVLTEGGSKRREAVEQAVRSLGGTLEAFYYAFGDHDFYIIIDVPSHVEQIAASLVTAASGKAHFNTVALVAPEEVDAAVERAQNADYRPPGQ